MKKLVLEVKENACIADKIYKMDLLCDPGFDIKNFLPGQFLHINCGSETFLRRPISLCDVNLEKNLLSILFRAEGQGTKNLSQMKNGEKLDCLGPLGNGFPIDFDFSGKTVLMVGGGIGVPPLYHLARELKNKGAQIKSVIGFNSKKDVFLEQEFKDLGEVFVTTIDGSHGHKGLVTDQVKLLNWDFLYSCGPTRMLEAIQKLFKGDKRPAFMSLEERMGCGIGACLACVCHKTENVLETLSPWEKSYKRICCEGPVFNLQEVVLHA